MMVMLSVEHTQAQRSTTATVDALRKEVHEANDQAMVGAIAHLNRSIGETSRLPNDSGASTRLLEG